MTSALTRDQRPSSGQSPSTGAEVLVKQLESYGVEVVFGLCGHTNIAVLDALSRSRIHFVTTRHEQGTAHMADGYARMTGKPGVVLTHAGPGMMNAITGAATAALDSIPLVVISGDVPSYYRGRGPHQELNLQVDGDQWELYRPFSKRTWRVDRPEDLPRYTERAFWTAQSGRPGAVLLSVPMDMWSRPLDSAQAERYPLPAEFFGAALQGGVAEQIVARVAAAKRPLLFIGGGVRRPDVRAAVLNVAERLGVPIAHSLMAKGALPDSHPLVMGMTGFWGTPLANTYAREADVILALGTRFAETDSSSWDERFTWNAHTTALIHIDIDPAEIGRNFPVAIGAVADLRHAAPQLAAAAGALPAREHAGLRKRIASARSTIWDETAERGRLDDFPLKPERILEDVRRTVPANSVLVTDVGWNKNGVAQRYRLPDEGVFLTPGGLATMGFGPGAAIGAKIGSPDRPVIALVGDGAMSSQLPVLPTAVEQGTSVVWVVMNNAAHGTIADLQMSHYGVNHGTLFKLPDGKAYTPDFAGIARACGAWAKRIESAPELVGALRDAMRAGGPALIDVPMTNDPVPTPGHWNINDIYEGRFD
ncbi:MAG: thiamine pyrophosphate-binding protein [Chloroflexi bacterium]|nr:MAG: thiamine pyrophosphate-binding protein [Chloroflexota bacterium]